MQITKNYHLQIYEKAMLMHVYRLNIFTNNIDKYNQGQGHYMKRIFCFYIYHLKICLQQTTIITATKILVYCTKKFKTMEQAVSIENTYS